MGQVFVWVPCLDFTYLSFCWLTLKCLIVKCHWYAILVWRNTRHTHLAFVESINVHTSLFLANLGPDQIQQTFRCVSVFLLICRFPWLSLSGQNVARHLYLSLVLPHTTTYPLECYLCFMHTSLQLKGHSPFSRKWFIKNKDFNDCCNISFLILFPIVIHFSQYFSKLKAYTIVMSIHPFNQHCRKAVQKRQQIQTNFFFTCSFGKSIMY